MSRRTAAYRTVGRGGRSGLAAVATLVAASALGAVGPLPVTATAAVRPARPVITVPQDLGSARARATALRHQIATLQVRAEAATEAYDNATARLGAVVTQHLLAQRQLDSARAATASADATEASTVRAIYRAGGTTALYMTVLEGESPSDVLSRLHALQSIVGGDHALIHSAQVVTSRADAIEHRLAGLAATQTKLELSVASTADRVRGALAAQRSLLATATAEVRRDLAAQTAALDASAARDAASTLDAARRGAVPGGPGDVGAPDTRVVAAAIAAARAELGKPYQWGATGPDSFDCSGLTGWAYRHAGVSLPRTSREQWFAGPHPGLGYLQPGDLLFWATDTTNPATIHHVALYIGGDQMIAAPHTGTDVQLQSVYLQGYIGAVRPTAAVTAPVPTPSPGG